MPSPNVTVTATIYDQAGLPVPGAVITARLTVVDSENGYIIPETKTLTADVNGVAAFSLWPNVLGISGSQYRFKARDPNTNQIIINGLATVPNSNTTLHAILPTNPPPTLDQATTAMNAAASSATNAAASETNAATSATSATASSALASTSATNAASSATTAAADAATASAQATNAASSATSSAASATAAAASETNAAASSANAASSATSATNSAASATTSSANAAASEASAATSSASAASSATSASSSATNAATSETNSAASATSAAADAALAMNRYSFQGIYNGATTYAKNDVVTSTTTGKGDSGFVSLQAGNLAHTPPLTGVADAWWGVYVLGGTDGVGAGDMLAANNLSDVVSVTTSRANLGLGTSSVLNVPAAGDALIGEVVKGSDTRLADSRAPTAHNHVAADTTDFQVTVSANTDVAANVVHAASAHAPSGATVNSTDAILLARANHTGTQPGTTVTNTPAGNIIATTAQAAIDELDTEKEPILGNPATDGDILASTIAGVRSWATPSGGGGGVNPNILINGNFDLWEDGTSWTSNPASTTYAADLFIVQNGSAVAIASLAQSTDVPTIAQSGVQSSYSLLESVTTADASVAVSEYFATTYNVEGFDFKQLLAGSATLSFWVKSSKIGIYCAAFRNKPATHSYVTEFTISAANTWEKKTITVDFSTAPGTWLTDTGTGLQLWITQVCGTTFQTTPNAWQTGNFLATANQVNWADTVGATFQIAQVKLEKGTSATAFVPRPYAEELDLATWYLEFMGAGAAGDWFSTTHATVGLNYGPKRATPTITLMTTTLRVLESGIINQNATAGTAVINSVNADGATVEITGYTGMVVGRSCIVTDPKPFRIDSRL